MLKKFLAATLVVFHVLTFSGPSLFAGESTYVKDPVTGEIIGQGSNIGLNGGTYDLYNADVAAGTTQSYTSLDGGQITLNIQDGKITEILGNLEVHDGPFVFYNPFGIHVGDTGTVTIDNAQLVFTSLGLGSDADLTGGISTFVRDFNKEAGAIINNGKITVSANSFFAMVGSAVANNGSINANGGAAVLAAGDKVSLDLTNGAGLIKVSIDEAVSAPVYDKNGNQIKDGIANSGTIKADGGLVILSARALDQIFDNVINHTGLIEANSVGSVNGRITLNGGDLGITSISGTLNALGDDLGETGGKIEVYGDKIALWDGTTINASGWNGGGTVLIGGDYQGLGASPNSHAVYMSKWADVKADALLEGDGGKIIFWSDDFTNAHGTISAKGGQLSGDGGLIETSSKGVLDVEGIGIDASAPAGKGGTWLLDPYNISIVAGNGTTNNTGAAAFTPTGNNSQIGVDLINTQLSNGVDVTVGTGVAGGQAGTITLGANIAKTAGANATLTFNAASTITLNGVIGATVGLLNVVLNAGGTVTMNNAINTNGGSLNVTVTGAGNDVVLNDANADINTAGGAASFNAVDEFNMKINGSSITTAGGQLDVVAGKVTTKDISTGAGDVNLTANVSSVNIGQTFSTTSGNIKADAKNGITLASAVQISTTGGNFTANADTDSNATGDFNQGAGGSFIHTQSGNIGVTANKIGLDGDLTTTSGNINLTTTNGLLDLTKTLNTGTGDINLNSDNGVRLNGANAVITTGGGDVNINANTDGDADGDFTQNSGVSSITTNGGNASITANDFQIDGTINAGSGDVSLLGAQANSTYLVGTGSAAGFTGSITGTEMQHITANNLTIGGSNVSGINVRGITAANSNNAGTTHIVAGSAAGNVSFDTAASTFNSLDASAANNVTFSTNVSTDSGNMTVTSDSDLSGTGAFTVDAGNTLSTNGSSFLANTADTYVNGAINSGTGAINGGNITINGSNQITVGATGSLNSTVGAGGIFSAVGAVTVNGTVTVGQGNIILNGGGASPDLIINAPIISATSIFLSALRDIIVQALVQTTNAADGNITLRADSDNDGVGGVWVQAAGKVDAAQNVDIIGSDLFAIPVTMESIQVDADGANDQIVALGNIDLHTAGFAPAGSNMNLNGIVNTAAGTLTVNSVGNINTSDNGVAELKANNLDLTAVTGIDAEIDANGVVFNNTTSGNVALEDMAGGLTVNGAANGGNGSTTITAHSPLTIASDIVQNGAVILTAGETAGAGDDLTVNNGVTVRSINDNVILNAGDNVNLNSGSTVQSDNASVSVNAGSGDTDGNGDVNLAGDVNALSNVILNALQGGITQTSGAISAGNLQFAAENSVSLASATNDFAAVTGESATGSINLGNSAANTTINDLTTTGNDITYNHNGAGSVDIVGTLDSGNAGSVDGGNITVNNLGGALTVKSTAVLTSLTGVGGAFTATNVTIEGGSVISAGLGNITLNGGGLDLIINVPIVSATSIFLSALRDIIVQAGITTTNAADGHITLRADSDNDGVGGVWLQSTGFINSADDVNILGSDLFAIPVTMESIQIDDNGGNQIFAANDITLQTTGFAPAGSDMNIYGVVNTPTGTIKIDSVGNVNTTDDGVAELISDQLKITAVEGIDAEIDANTVAYLNTTSGDVNLEDMAGGLTVGTVDGLVGGTNNGGATSILTHSPLNVASNVTSAGQIDLTAGETAGAGDDLTLGATVESTGGDVNLKAGDNVVFNAGGLAKSDTGAVNVDSGNGDVDGLGDINFNGGQVNAATDAALTSIGAINGFADGVADVIGDSINLIAQNGGINDLDVTAGSILNADTTADNGNILLNSIGDLPIGLVNAGPAGNVTINSTGTIEEAVSDDGAPVADVIGATLQFNTTGSDIGASLSFLDIYPYTSFGATTNGGDAYINCMSPICAVGQIDLGTGTWFFNAVGDVVDFNDLVFGEPPVSTGIWNVTAGGAVLNIGGNFGSSTNAIEMRLSDYNGVFESDGRLESTTGGGLFVTNKNNTPGFGLTFGGITGNPNAITAGGDVVVFSGSPATVAANITAVGNITLASLGSALTDNFTINPNLSITSTGAGDVLIVAGNNVVAGANTVVSTTGTGNVTVAAGEDFTNLTLDRDGNAGGDVIMDPTSAFRSEDGNITVNAESDIFMAEVNADSNADGVEGNVNTNSFTGSTIDNNDIAPNPLGTLNVTGHEWNAFAGDAIGSFADPIESSATVITGLATNDIVISNQRDVRISLNSLNGSIGFSTIGDIFLGVANAPGGNVSLAASGSIYAISAGTHVTANSNINLAAGGVIGTIGAGVDTHLNNPGTLSVNAGSSIDGVSANIGGNFGPSSVTINGAPGLVLLNGIAVGGEGIGAFSTARSSLYVDQLPFNQLSTGRLDGRYAADFPGFYNSDRFAVAPLVSIDTTRLDTIPVLEALPPTVVPIPGEAPAAQRPAAQETPAQAPALQRTPSQNPPTVVPIPAEATPTLEQNVEQNKQQ